MLFWVQQSHEVCVGGMGGACVPSKVICYFGVLQNVNQKVYRVFSGQSTITIYNDVEYKLESLVDVLCVKELREKTQTEETTRLIYLTLVYFMD